MDDRRPLVSVIVPCYNQAEYLSEALETVLEQTFTNWECIIVDDGSPDNTHDIAVEWLQKDSRFKYIKKENGGLSSARNTGIETARGEFILPLDADDKISPNYLGLSINEFQKDQELKIVYCKAEKFGAESGLWRLPHFSLQGLAKSNMIFCSAVFRKRDWELVGGYDSKMIYGLEDWEFWVAILKLGGNVKRLDVIGFYYRIKKDSMAKSMSENEILISRKFIANKHLDFILNEYDALLKKNNEMNNRLSSEKYVINLFTKMFLGFKIFK
ncbi:MAG: glycosyltransferase family 2 protein [Flavobacteriaceae bacterium]|nr:glycosyltransferase family 2 protein [Flavobacteriaceae bacterium]